MTDLRDLNFSSMDMLLDFVPASTVKTEDFSKNLSTLSLNNSILMLNDTFENENTNLKTALYYVLFLMLIFIMLGMGCEITLSQVFIAIYL